MDRSSVLVMLVWTLCFLVAADAAQAQQGVRLEALGHFYVGGHTITVSGTPRRPKVSAPGLPPKAFDPNGTFTVGATYVGYAKLAHPRHHLPILMLPGGGLSGTVYETTPDGRPGWQWAFLRAGFSTFVADYNQTGRSPWARVPEIDPLEPSFRTQTFIWEVFRIGPPGSFSSSTPRSYADTLFPTAAFEQFASQAAPYFRPAAGAEAAALDAIVQAACPCILLTHSASGQAGMDAAVRWPALIKAVVSVEPAGAPADVPARLRTPHLFVWGDHLDPAEADPSWRDEHTAGETYQRLLAARGAAATELSLPARGIRGNSHMLMSDRNSDQVAGLIVHWAEEQGL